MRSEGSQSGKQAAAHGTDGRNSSNESGFSRCDYRLFGRDEILKWP